MKTTGLYKGEKPQRTLQEWWNNFCQEHWAALSVILIGALVWWWFFGSIDAGVWLDVNFF